MKYINRRQKNVEGKVNQPKYLYCSLNKTIGQVYKYIDKDTQIKINNIIIIVPTITYASRNWVGTVEKI